MAKRSKVRKSKDAKIYNKTARKTKAINLSSGCEEEASGCEHHDCSGNRSNHHRNVQRSIRTHRNGHRHYQKLEEKQMSNNVYGIFDNCVMGYITIFTEREDKVAERNFKIALTDEHNIMSKTPSDYRLVRLAKFDEKDRPVREREGEHLRWHFAQ